MSDKFKTAAAAAQMYNKTRTISDQEIKCFWLEIV
jgi:hypothetical protein